MRFHSIQCGRAFYCEPTWARAAPWLSSDLNGQNLNYHHWVFLPNSRFEKGFNLLAQVTKNMGHIYDAANYWHPESMPPAASSVQQAVAFFYFLIGMLPCHLRILSTGCLWERVGATVMRGTCLLPSLKVLQLMWGQTMWTNTRVHAPTHYVY